MLTSFNGNPPTISIVSPICAPTVAIQQPSSSRTSTHLNSQPLSVHPFCLKFISNKITKCQGCRKNFRSFSSCVLHPPSDLIFSRLECRPFVRPDGTIQVPATPSNYHYHLELSCVQAASPGLTTINLTIPDDVKLKLRDCHKLALLSKFGVYIASAY